MVASKGRDGVIKTMKEIVCNHSGHRLGCDRVELWCMHALGGVSAA